MRTHNIITVKDFPIFGGIIRKCWDIDYPSVEDLKQDVVSGLKVVSGGMADEYKGNNVIKVEKFEARVCECKACILRCKPELGSSVSSAL